MTPRLQAAVLVLFGAALARLASGDQLARYVRPGTRPLVLAAGVVLCAVGTAVAVLCRPVPEAGRLPEHLPEAVPVARDAAIHESAVTRAVWLLLGPVVTIAVVAPPALGVLTANRPPVAPPRPSSGFAALAPGDPTPILLSDVVLRTVWHAGSTLRGRTLRVIGFVARPARHGFVLARLVITCCAADARPYDIDVTSPTRAPPAGTWVAVTGRYLGAGTAGPVVPAVHASQVLTVAPPSNPYG